MMRRVSVHWPTAKSKLLCMVMMGDQECKSLDLGEGAVWEDCPVGLFEPGIGGAHPCIAAHTADTAGGGLGEMPHRAAHLWRRPSRPDKRCQVLSPDVLIFVPCMPTVLVWSDASFYYGGCKLNPKTHKGNELLYYIVVFCKSSDSKVLLCSAQGCTAVAATGQLCCALQ